MRIGVKCGPAAPRAYRAWDAVALLIAMAGISRSGSVSARMFSTRRCEDRGQVLT